MRPLSLVATTATVAVLAIGAFMARADGALPGERQWEAIVADARGQTVYFNAWGGDERINDYIAWAGDRLAERYDITLNHVKLSNTTDAVTRVLAEKSAGRLEGGSVDLIWINGENFAAMLENDLLFGPFAEDLPNFRHVDVEGKPSTTVDFTIPVDGMEAPWGMAQLTFMYDTAYIDEPPRSLDALLAFAEDNPGRFTYPAPPDFIGTTFLKQALHTLVDDPGILQDGTDDARFAATTEPLWDWLDALHPHLWRGGQSFPGSSGELRRLLDDGEVEIAFSYNPADASSAIEQNLLPETIRTFQFEDGTLGNSHFLAIPFNANAKEAAMVTANFLMSPEAQLHKEDPEAWGDPTILDVEGLPEEDRAAFEALPRGIATLAPGEMSPILLEPHPDWTVMLEEEWQRRYSR